MAYTVTKVSDGDHVLGNYRLEHVILQPAAADYATGGYVISGIPPSSGNVGITKVGFCIPIGGQAGYVPVWNPATKKLQIWQDSGVLGQLSEVPAATDLSALAFNLWVIGY